MRQSHFLSAAAFAFAMCSVPANAAVIIATETGTVFFTQNSGLIDGGIFSGVTVGSSWSSTFIYNPDLGGVQNHDPANQFSEGGTHLGTSSPFISASVTIAGVTYNSPVGEYSDGLESKETSTHFKTYFAFTNLVLGQGIIQNLSFSLADTAGSVPGVFTGPYPYSVQPGDSATANFSVNNNGSLGAIDATLTGVSIMSAVPEPTTWALFIIGFGGIGLELRRRRQRPLGRASA